MLSRIGPAGWLHLLIFGALIPFAAWRSRARIETRPLPPKKPYFTSVVLQQLVFGLISLVVARTLLLQPLAPYRPTLSHVAAGAAILAGVVLFMRPRWRRKVQSRDRRVYLVTPVDAQDHALWAMISLSAGILEEITYRGVLFWILMQLTGSPISGALLSAVAFGIGHAVQGWKSVLVATLFALGFQGVVAWTGTLYVAMAIHVVYDVIAGFSYGYFAKKLGYPEEPMPVPQVSPAPATPELTPDSSARTPS